MRTFLIIFLTMLALGGGFAIYLSLQNPVAKKPTKSLVATPRTQRSAATTQSVHGIGSGDNPWIKRFEKGELASQFRGVRWEPRGGELVFVTRPEAEFFSGDGQQLLRVEGESGEVTVPGGGQPASNARPGGVGGAGAGGNFTPPNRGRLQTVKISMYEPADAVEPMLVATMPNAAFDNDTFRIATEAYTDAAGKRIEADQVPVIVTGRDYDFSGRGLVIRWNQGDRKLQLLQVEHGESLTVKNLSALSKPTLTPAPPAPPAPATAPTAMSIMSAMLASADPRDAVLLAAADPTPAPAAAPAPAPAKKRKPRPATRPPLPVAPATHPRASRDLAPVVYRATFDTDVKIFEAEKQVATANLLEIDLLQPPREDPATQPSDESTATTTTSTTHPAKRDRPRGEATAAPATQGPITVKWTGKLRVVPLEGPTPAGLLPGKAIVRLIGAPVFISRDDMEARSGVVTFNSADGSASLESNEIVPIVTMTVGDGTKITTPSITYITAPDGTRVATLIGKSRADLAAKGTKDPLTLTWNKDGRMRMVDLPSGRSAIEQADFSGDVKIVHPDLDMTSEALSLRFDPSRALKPEPTQPAGSGGAAGAAPSPADNDVADSLREIIAQGNVNCRMHDAGEPRTIAAQKLNVELDRSPAGERYARVVRAEGDVRTQQGKDALSAGRLTAELAPATQPAAVNPIRTVDASDAKPATSPFGGASAQLVSLIAQDKVNLTTADGSTAAAETLKVQKVNGHEQYQLFGNPATVMQGKTVISGPAIRFAPDEQIAEVIGVGGMKGTLPDDPKQSFDIAWAGGAVVNGATNFIDVTDKVVIKSTQADGSISTATSPKLRARLEPKAPTTKGAVTKPSSSQSDKMNFLAGKEITSATLTGDDANNVEAKSELFAEDGSLARGLNLYAKTITTNRVTSRLEVPVPGKMLYQDHRPPAGGKADDPGGASVPGAAKEGPTLGSGRGHTAFLWQKSLVYDDAQPQVVMTGDVRVVHHPETKDGQPFNLWADSLTAELEADPDAKPPAPNPAAAVDKQQSKMRLKRVLARGNVKVESTRMNIDARDLSYDPVAQVLHAR
ncbi:MAG: hypothetical protein QOF78_1871, partial [Phycisphaerales bacterium]|nr:hypothetical protein [Phycisphaerales bacterium]